MTTRTAQFAVIVAAAVNAAPAVGAQSSTYSAPAFLPTSGNYSRLIRGDVNGDGHLDLVALGQTSLPAPVQSTQAALGNSAGAFIAGTPQLAGTSMPWPVDWNADGKLDLVSTTGGLMNIALGSASGQFTSGGSVAVPFTTLAHQVAGDLNSDGITDVLHSSPGSGGLFVTDGASSTTAVLPGVSGASAALADFDADGDLDVICTALATLLAIRQTTPGVFQFATSSVAAAGLAPLPGSIAIGNANGDAAIDLLHLPAGASQATLYLGALSGNFSPGGVNQTVFNNPLLVNPLPGAIVDVTGDGLGEIFTYSGTTIFQRNALAPGLWNNASTLTAAGSVNSLALADYDADGLMDLAAGQGGLASIAYFDNGLSSPASTAGYGVGTPGCNGAQGLRAMAAPSLGSAQFGFQTTQAPLQSLGLLILCDASSAPGFDAFGIGLTLHVIPQASTTIVALDCFSDVVGLSTVSTPVPNNTGLLGLTLNAETIWAWQPCSPSPFKLSSSRALSFTVIP